MRSEDVRRRNYMSDGSGGVVSPSSPTTSIVPPLKSSHRARNADDSADTRQLAEEQQLFRENAKRRNYCRKFLKFCFSHIGLCGMVVAYSVAGGFIFEHLEKTNEKQECVKKMEKYYPFENETIYNLWDIAQNFRDDDYKEAAFIEYTKLISAFRKSVLDLGYDGSNCTIMGEVDGPGYQWSFAGALLFSVTVITTIGYGNIAPKTFWGRLVCIAYATLGIPLMLLCLANIGDVMADIFRFVYSKFCCCGCCRKRKPTSNKEPEMIDDSVPESERGGSSGSVPGSRPDSAEAWKTKYRLNQTSGALQAHQSSMVQDYYDYDYDDDDEDDDDDSRISVPLTITMAVIGGYVFMGALLFGVWEGWTPLQASYFCFVTISTIGFGDLVPGYANFQKKEDQYKMVLSAVYMMFGMAILSMCFSLIQEEIVSKFRWIGEKLGILDKHDDTPEDVEGELDSAEQGEDGVIPGDEGLSSGGGEKKSMKFSNM